jgi:hypothetical protein
MATLKQKKAIKNMVENGGVVSSAMRDAGYSLATANTPQKLTESKGFEELKLEYKKELLAKGIDGKRLAKKMDEWLEAEKPFSSHTEPDKLVPDYQIQIKAGEMLREDLGLKSDKDKGNTNIQFNTFIKQEKNEFGI